MPADRPSTRWLTGREQFAWRALLEMWTRLSAELARDMAANSELSMADFAVLVALTDSCGGRVRAYALAETLQWEKSRLSHQLARMHKRGLVDREECREDGRGQIVAVTAQGQRAIEAAAPAHVAAVRRLFLDAVSPEQLDMLAEVAVATLDRIDPAARVPGVESPASCSQPNDTDP